MKKTATIQDMQENFSQFLEHVKEGVEIILTDGKQSFATISPIQKAISVQTQAAVLEPLPEGFWCG